MIGVSLAFLVIFSMWGLWVGVVTLLTTNGGLYADAGITSYPNFHAIYCHSGMIAACIVVIAFLRFGLGPVLGPGSRTVLAATLLFFVVCVWEALDCVVAVFTGSKTVNTIYYYSAVLALSVILTIAYEVVTGYDVIGSHLLL